MPTTTTVTISSDLECGNMEYVSQHVNAHDPSVVDVHMRIRPDVYTELEDLHHSQYFCFQSTVVMTTSSSTTTTTATSKIRYVIDNAQDVSYPEAWPGTTVSYTHDSNDVDSWHRNMDTFYTQGQLHWEHQHTLKKKKQNEEESDDDCLFQDTVYFSYYPIYSRARHQQLLQTILLSQSMENDSDTASATGRAQSQILVLGQSLQGRDMTCLRIGTGSTIGWIIHRQHPGETMAEHYAEGLIQRLLNLPQRKEEEEEDESDDKDSIVSQVLSQYTLYIVPCMCPDGAVLGHLRTNASGANLNREWANATSYKDGSLYEAPTLQRSPEVYCVLDKMVETGCDCFVDVHGDEELPFNFTSGANLVPNWSPRLESLLGAFTASYSRFNSDMQQQYGYPPPESREEVLKYLNVATNQVTHRFDCLAVTLEMPFKDCRTNPDPQRGWSPARCRQLGASLVSVLNYVHPYLRGDAWTQLPPEDSYVVTTDDYGQDHGDNGEEQFQMLKKRFYSDVHEIHKHPSPTAASSALPANKSKFR